MASNLIWTHDVLQHLIDLFRDRAILWDTTLEDYKVRSKKSEAWQQIADILNLDRAAVEKKIRMLVGQYRRELQKESSGTPSKWFAFHRLSFLGAAQENSSHSCYASEQGTPEFVDTRSEEGSNMEDSMDTHEELARKRARPTKRHVLNEETSDLVALFREEKRSRDEYTVFGEHVAHKMRKITNSKARATTQYLINQILYNAEMGKYDKSYDRNRASSSTGVANRNEMTEIVDEPESVLIKVENEVW